MDNLNKAVKIEEKKPKTLPERMANIEDTLNMMAKVDKKGKIKPYKLKWKIKSKLKSVARKNKMLVWVLGTNGNMYGELVEMKGGFIIINGVPRKCTMDYRYLFNGKTPCIVLPEWSLEPIGLEAYYQKNPEGLPQADAEKLILAVSESGEVKTKGGLSGKAWVFIGLAIVAGLYILMGQG